MEVNLKHAEYVDLSLTAFRIVDGCIPCVSYTLLLEDDGVSWTLERRFREMADFYNGILATHKKCALPPFPPKSWLPSTEKSFINKRKQDMQNCLRALMQVPEIEKNQALRDFFEFERSDVVHHRDARHKARNVANECRMQENRVTELRSSIAQRESALDLRETSVAAREAELAKSEEKLRAEEQALSLRKAHKLRDIEKKEAEWMKKKKDMYMEWADSKENEFAEKVKCVASLITPESGCGSIEALGKAIEVLVAENDELRSANALLKKRLIAAVEEASAQTELHYNKDSPQPESPPTTRDTDSTTHDSSTARTNMTTTSDFGRTDTATTQYKVVQRVTHPVTSVRTQPLKSGDLGTLIQLNPSASPYVPQRRQVPHLPLSGATSPVMAPPFNSSRVSTPRLLETRKLNGIITVPQLNMNSMQPPPLLFSTNPGRRESG